MPTDSPSPPDAGGCGEVDGTQMARIVGRFILHRRRLKLTQRNLQQTREDEDQNLEQQIYKEHQEFSFKSGSKNRFPPGNRALPRSSPHRPERQSESCR